MALITCPECKNSASSAAAACPHCGFAIADFLKREEAARIQREVAAKKKASETKVAAAVGVLIIVFSIFCCCSNMMSAKERAKQKEEQEQAAKLKAEQEAKAKAERVADTKSNMDTHVDRLKLKLEGEDVAEATKLIVLIQEAEPAHPYLAEANAALAAIQQRQLVQKMREDAAASKQQADERAKAKQYVDADDLYGLAISSISSIPEDQRTKEDTDLSASAEKARSKISKQADKIRKAAEKQYAEAAAQAARCGGKTDCIEITAQQLCSKYDENEVRADEIYKGRTLVITGRVDSISKDFTNDMFVSLNTSYNCLYVRGGIASDQKENMKAISKGDKITIRCTGAGLIINSPMAENCVLVEYWSRN